MIALGLLSVNNVSEGFAVSCYGLPNDAVMPSVPTQSCLLLPCKHEILLYVVEVLTMVIVSRLVFAVGCRSWANVGAVVLCLSELAPLWTLIVARAAFSPFLPSEDIFSVATQRQPLPPP